MRIRTWVIHRSYFRQYFLAQRGLFRRIKTFEFCFKSTFSVDPDPLELDLLGCYVFLFYICSISLFMS